MRKRSDVVQQPVAPANQQTFDSAAQKPPGATLDFVNCPKCNVRQSKGMVAKTGGACIRCGSAIPADAEVTEKVPLQVAGPKKEPDPWQLRPESIQPAATETRVSVGVDPAKPGSEATAAPKVDAASGQVLETRVQPMGGDIPFTQLAVGLNSYGFKASVIDIAQWTPEQRAHAIFVCSALDKQLDPKIEDWLLARRVTSETKYLVEPDKAKPSPEKQPGDGCDSSSSDSDDEDTEPMSIRGSEGDTVTVVWGEEKFTPIKDSYSTCTVGPFSATVRLRRGELRQDVYRRVMAELEAVAFEERARKATEFVKALKSLRAEARAEAN